MWLDLSANEYGARHSLKAQRTGNLFWPAHDVDPGLQPHHGVVGWAVWWRSQTPQFAD
jgi:hypothetical protein